VDGIADVLQWATGSLQGVAFVEYLILAAVIFLWREIRATNKRIDGHETECAAREKATGERLAEGSTKMALLEERTRSMQSDIREIKEAVKAKP